MSLYTKHYQMIILFENFHQTQPSNTSRNTKGDRGMHRARNVGKGQVYITQKNVPPKTIANDGTSINGPTPPPETIAYIINPSAPINPRREAISIVFPL